MTPPPPSFRTLRNGAMALSLVTVAILSLEGLAPRQTAPAPAPPARAAEEAGGEHDFDFEIGAWTTHLRRLERPLSGSTTWVEYAGTTVVRKVWDGRANLVELEVDGPSGHIQGLSLRLYNPQSRQWSLNFANSRQGMLTPPVFGRFKNGRGEFFGQDTLGEKSIFVRFIITPIAPDAIRFEQAFSDDGGRTWEVNWIATDTRQKD